jgi:hypothetical protein
MDHVRRARDDDVRSFVVAALDTQILSRPGLEVRRTSIIEDERRTLEHVAGDFVVEVKWVGAGERDVH